VTLRPHSLPIGTIADPIRNSAVERLSELTRELTERHKGYSFARYSKALAMGQGDLLRARAAAEGMRDHRVSAVLKAGVDAGSTDPGNWSGGSLSEYAVLEREFVGMLEPMTIIGRLNGARHVPLNVRFPRETSGASVSWVGQSLPTPASELSLESDTLGAARVAGIVAITKELAVTSRPAAVPLIRDDLLKGVARFLDQQLIDPSIAAAADTNPASLTYGATTVQSSGSTAIQIANDLGGMVSALATAGAFRNPVWIMHTSSAAALAAKMSTTGSPAFPDARVTGGTAFGVPIIASSSVPYSVSAGSIVVLLDAAEVLIADDSPIVVDVTSEASVQMLSNPVAGAAQQVNFYQANMIGIRVSALRNWKMAHADAIVVLDNTHW